MSVDALRNVECQGTEETYTVEKTGVSDMVVVLNGVEYDKEGEILHRVNDGFSVRLHFHDTATNIINDIENTLKEQYITENYNNQIGE